MKLICRQKSRQRLPYIMALDWARASLGVRSGLSASRNSVMA